MNKHLLLALVAFLVPICTVVTLGGEAVSPYFIGNPKTAEGRLLYFASKT